MKIQLKYLSLLLLLSGVAQAQQPGVPAEQSVGLMRAAYSTDPWSIKLGDAIKAKNREILDDILSKHPDIPKEQTQMYLGVGAEGSGTQIQIHLSTPDHAHVETLFNETVAHLREIVLDDWKMRVKENQDVIAQLQLQIAKDQEEVAVVQKRIADLEMFLRGNQMIDRTVVDIISEENSLQLTVQKLELELAGLKARREAIAESIETERKRQDAAQNSSTKRSIAEALAQELAAREEAVNLAKAQYKAAIVTAREVADAEAALAVAKVKSLTSKSADAEAPLLTELNHQLVMTSIDERQKRGERDAGRLRLEELSNAMQKLSQLSAARSSLEEISQKIQTAKQQVESSKQWLAENEKKPPTVTVR